MPLSLVLQIFAPTAAGKIQDLDVISPTDGLYDEGVKLLGAFDFAVEQSVSRCFLRKGALTCKYKSTHLRSMLCIIRYR